MSGPVVLGTMNAKENDCVTKQRQYGHQAGIVRYAIYGAIALSLSPSSPRSVYRFCTLCLVYFWFLCSLALVLFLAHSSISLSLSFPLFSLSHSIASLFGSVTHDTSMFHDMHATSSLLKLQCFAAFTYVELCSERTYQSYWTEPQQLKGLHGVLFWSINFIFYSK